ncbi:hypothetical protein Pcinc_042744 [Petrolisthes cinctipes]|uniref:Uncharacterized protein n=1 Tax=Petrolisthes cinctipes TaxID=88211 RepID=A0AAE1BH24_PETCI|nr:hypothetical protein Pcinc_042744 [Petrolisthes cinctipes]
MRKGEGTSDGKGTGEVEGRGEGEKEYEIIRYAGTQTLPDRANHGKEGDQVEDNGLSVETWLSEIREMLGGSGKVMPWRRLKE